MGYNNEIPPKVVAKLPGNSYICAPLHPKKL